VTLICFASFKGSPGVTSTALATAAAWPQAVGRHKLFLEADADGGAVALRFQLPTVPGLISLAAAARSGLYRDQLWDHVQVLPGGLPAVLAPDGPEEATVVIRGIGRELGQWLGGLTDVDVIADLGRLSIGSPSWELVRSAQAVLIVARPEVPLLQPSAERMAALAGSGLPVGWVLIGDRPYSAQQVAGAYGFPVIEVLPADQKVARSLEGGTHPARLRRSTLVRSVAALAERLSASVERPTPSALPPAQPSWDGYQPPASGEAGTLGRPPSNGSGLEDVSPAMRAALDPQP
jgi:MinD-like ATPase involved in chromosome partitioning or flagellar assembly